MFDIIEKNNLIKVNDNQFTTSKPKFPNYIKERFELNEKAQKIIKAIIPPFGYDGFGEFVFYRTYSRLKSNGDQENWGDCIIRVVNGVFSIRKDWYQKHCIRWDEDKWQAYAGEFAVSMAKMFWLPPGRGLWAMGTEYTYERGSAALYNCSATKTDDLPNDCHWLMDMLMNGVGVGFEANEDKSLKTYRNSCKKMNIIIGDSREEWCDSVKVLLESFLNPFMPEIHFDYSKIRPAGLPIKGFGGISSGPEPLAKLHDLIRTFCSRYINELNYDSIRLKADIINSIGCCVVAGNVRRSAEICIGSIDSESFLNLKDYEKNPDRAEYGWMSNNSVRLEKSEDFERLGEIARRVIVRGEPGYINKLNIKHGRIGKYDIVKEDVADLVNPCGEIPLENKEVCNICETFPTQGTVDDWYKSCDYGCTYCSTVTLLPTHRPETNEVILRNRRIGVGLVDFTGWKHVEGVARITRHLREGYKIVDTVNKKMAAEAGVPESIRKTTVKPGGTVPKLAGKTSGIGYPNFIHEIRRVRVQANHPIAIFLAEHKVPFEKDFYSDNTYVFEFPVKCGPAKPADEISLWEQAMNVVLIQREWADNAVSNTLNFRPKWKLVLSEEPKTIQEYEEFVDMALVKYNFGFNYQNLDYFKNLDLVIDNDVKLVTKFTDDSMEVKIYEYDPNHEEDHIEAVLASVAPLSKSISLLPHTPFGAYKQMPEQGISEEEYHKRKAVILPMNWTTFKGSDGEDEKYCTGDSCSR